MLFITGILGLFTSIIPQDPVNAEVTISGILHITAVAIMALITMVFPLLIGFGMKGAKNWKHFKIYSLLSVLIIIIFGGLSPLIISKGIPLMGLFQRITIGAYFQWLILFFIKFYKYQTSVNSQGN